MKRLLGVLSALCVLAGAIFTILAVWNVYSISWVIVVKIAITIGVVCLTLLLGWLIKIIFFKGDTSQNR